MLAGGAVVIGHLHGRDGDVLFVDDGFVLGLRFGGRGGRVLQRLDPLPRADRRVEFIRDSLVGVDAELKALGASHGVDGCGLLVLHGAMAAEGLRFDTQPDGRLKRTVEQRFNSAMLVRNGRVMDERYDKIDLMPFGEYIPKAGLVARLGIPGLETLTGGGFSPGPGPRLVAPPGLPPFLPLHEHP